LYLAPYQPTETCTFRSCEGYHPEQLWYFNVADRFLEQSTYTASINHAMDKHNDGMMLTRRTPTFAHHCLAHVLSSGDSGTAGGTLELWGGPLSGGAWVLGMLNTGTTNATISAPFSALEAAGIGPTTSFCVRDVWARKTLGSFKGSFSAQVTTHDLGVYKLTPGACSISTKTDDVVLEPAVAGSFRFASSQGNKMVLQMAPHQATLWGFVDPGASVSVHFKEETLAATTGSWLNQSTWLVKLPATEGGTAEYNISATSGSNTITLSSVLFGDVWVCSGQSNSESRATHAHPRRLQA
jgi:hypothetical protein